MSFADQALDTLNGITDEQYRDGDWWWDIVANLEGYDDKMSQKIDISYRSQQVAFVDGSVAEFNEGTGQWEVAPYTVQEWIREYVDREDD